MANTVGTVAAWVAALISLAALTWALIVFAIGRISDDHVAANSVVLEETQLKPGEEKVLIIHNFGDHPVRDLGLTLNETAISLPGTFIPPNGQLELGQMQSSTEGLKAVTLTYADAWERIWQQRLGGYPKRLRRTPAEALRHWFS